MNVLECIRARRSVRTFDETPLTPEDAAAVLSFAEKLETPYDIPITWKLLDAKRQGLKSPVIVGTDTFIAGKMPRVPHAEEAFGYAFEKVVLFAESRGIGTTWIAGTMDRPAFERAMDLRDGEVMPCVSPLGYPAKKMSMREAIMRKGIKADARLPFETLFYSGSFDTPLVSEAAGTLFDALEAVRLGPSAVNKQPWRVVVCGEGRFSMRWKPFALGRLRSTSSRGASSYAVTRYIFMKSTTRATARADGISKRSTSALRWRTLNWPPRRAGSPLR